MASLRQINASRINGARSKGPVTPEGKARVAQNGTTHGIYSKVVVLQNEDYSLYEESREGHLQEWEPATPTEYNFVMDIVDARWRLRRFSTFETAAIDFEVERMRPEIEEAFTRIDEASRATFAFNSLISNNRTFEVLQSAMRQQHRIIDRSVTQLRRLRKDRLDNDGGSGGGGGRKSAPTRSATDDLETASKLSTAPATPPTPAAKGKYSEDGSAAQPQVSAPDSTDGNVKTDRTKPGEHPEMSCTPRATLHPAANSTRLHTRSSAPPAFAMAA